jgi:tRNA A-37 threonylcarbamoyl transferase component Bud32
VIHVIYQHDPEVTAKLFELCDRAGKVLLFCGLTVEPGVDVRSRKPLRQFEAQIGDIVDSVAVVDEGKSESMWRDPFREFCQSIFAGHPEAAAAPTNYFFVRGREPLHVTKKKLWAPGEDLKELLKFAESLDDKAKFAVVPPEEVAPVDGAPTPPAEDVAPMGEAPPSPPSATDTVRLAPKNVPDLPAEPTPENVVVRFDALAAEPLAPPVPEIGDKVAVAAPGVAEGSGESESVGPTKVSDPLVGTKLGDYLITGMIGSGAMGIVYRGVQPVIEKPVAVKVLRRHLAGDTDAARRLLQEARAVAAIRHRGIVEIFNFGTLTDGRDYLVMEFLEGESLEEVIIREGAMPPEMTLPVLDEILDALAAAHNAGVVHRDLKPTNVFLVSPPHGAARYVKLLDFGLAKQTLGALSGEGTQPQAVLGTPMYMAPEQVMSEPVSPRTDLYALGLVAFEMLTGRTPFQALSSVEVMAAHLSAIPPAPSSVTPDIPAELDALILELLQKKPDQRPESAGVVRDRVRTLIREIEKKAEGGRPSS